MTTYKKKKGMLPPTDKQRTKRDETEKDNPRQRTPDTWKEKRKAGEGVNGAGFEGGGRVTFYLRKRAASEEVEQPETLTGDSYTDLRRQDRGTRRERERDEGGTDTNKTGRRGGGGGGEERGQKGQEQDGIKVKDRSWQPNRGGDTGRSLRSGEWQVGKVTSRGLA